jgi:lipopolysaccharide transport system permease protein
MNSAAKHARTLVLRPGGALSWQDFVDAWDHRELLLILAMRDIKVRYKQALLGAAWALLQPLSQMLIFTIIFNRLAGIRSEGGVPYAVFCLAGLTVWGLFSNGLSHASESLLHSANLVTKVYFPRIVVPLATVVTAVVDSSIAGLLLVAVMVVTGVPFHASSLLAIPIAGVAALWAAAIGIWTSAFNLRYRDVRHALPFLIQLGVYATPVFYPVSMIPERFRGLLALNPLVAVVEGFRAALFGNPIPYAQLLLTIVIALVVGLLGFIRFLKVERTFADVI